MRDIEESSLARLTIPDVLTPGQYYGVRAQHPETHGDEASDVGGFRRSAALSPDLH